MREGSRLRACVRMCVNEEGLPIFQSIFFVGVHSFYQENTYTHRVLEANWKFTELKRKERSTSSSIIHQSTKADTHTYT